MLPYASVGFATGRGELRQRCLNVDVNGVDQWADSAESRDRYDGDECGEKTVFDHVLATVVFDECSEMLHWDFLLKHEKSE